MKQLPIGIQDFQKIVDNNLHYVDKTEVIHRLLTCDTVFFLSRPRRFGKSLLCSTLGALWEGKHRGYLTPYQGRGKKLIKVGVSFDAEKRNIGEWLSQEA